MRAHALIQLTQVGLKFNEAKSDNPFAYLTAIVNNAFIRQLKKEKIQGDIKNELREYAGLDGSFDRQAGGGVGEVSER
jgi:DNA-directed RNA polymerase specialized sigma24 family protein